MFPARSEARHFLATTQNPHLHKLCRSLAVTVTNLISCSKHLHLCQTKERGEDLIDPWGPEPAASGSLY